jgi:hypothetical protein
VRYIPYGQRVSFGFVQRDALNAQHAAGLAGAAAADVAAWDQRGCFAPHAFFVEFGGRVSPEEFARLLSHELEKREAAEPRGPLSPAESSAIAARRSFYRVRAEHSPDTKLWSSPGSTAWTVVYEADAAFQASCRNRFVYVKGVADLGQVLRGADPVRGRVSTVGLAATAAMAPALAAELARWGVCRVCRIGQMQRPPIAWRQDGRPALADWIAWTDWER